jgi:FtsP/CotA-like multicopper oxidase with cupredoxin domain
MSNNRDEKGKPLPYNQPGQDEEPVVDSSRRGFLRTAALTGGALAAGGRIAVGAERAGHAGMAHRAMDHGTMGHGPGRYGSMMFMKGHKTEPGVVIEPPGAPSDEEVEYREFDMDIRLAEHEILPGVKVHFFAFNGQVPGPEFHVTEGEWIKVNFTNHTEEMHTIHWHGLTVPYTMDGVPMVTQDPVHPGHTFVYRFQAKPGGTRWYHCHWGTPLHAYHAMHGAFVIHKRDDPLKARFPYEREYVLLLEAWDTNFAREEIAGILEGMRQVNILLAQGKLDPITHGFFRSYEEFVDAYRRGEYIPPYLLSRSSGIPFEPNYFGINGKAYPATQRMRIRQGEWIRVRIVSASTLNHHMHLHGHDFWWVAQDGNDLSDPRRLNTLHVQPGGTYDIVIHGDNPGFWTFHDHNTNHVRNNGIYPGGMLMLLEYEDFEPTYTPSVSVDQ